MGTYQTRRLDDRPSREARLLQDRDRHRGRSPAPIVYFRKCGKCTTAKGADRQHNRIVNETVDAWRQFSQQIRRYTISRVPADVVVKGEVRSVRSIWTLATVLVTGGLIYVCMMPADAQARPCRQSWT